MFQCDLLAHAANELIARVSAWRDPDVSDLTDNTADSEDAEDTAGDGAEEQDDLGAR